MTATDIRNANFDQLRDTLEEKLREVYEAFACHGPCTTRQLADAARMDILSVRPRATDLLHLGLLAVSGSVVGPSGRKEGRYEATTPEEWQRWRQQNFPTDSQLQMGLNAGALTA